MAHVLLRTPIIGALPGALHATIEGTYDTVVGLAKTLSSDEGPAQVHDGVTKLTLAPYWVLISPLNLNPYRAPINTVPDDCVSHAPIQAISAFHANIEDNTGVIKRVAVLVDIPLIAIARIADLAIGAVALIFALMTAGMSETVNRAAASHLFVGLMVLPDVGIAPLRLIRPISSVDTDEIWHVKPYYPNIH